MPEILTPSPDEEIPEDENAIVDVYSILLFMNEINSIKIRKILNFIFSQNILSINYN